MRKVLWLFNFDALQLHGKGPDFKCFLGLYWILLALEHVSEGTRRDSSSKFSVVGML